MAVLVENFRSGTITSSISDIDTTISSAEFADLGVVASPDTMKIVLDPEGAAGDPEIVTITVHTASATSVTVTRSGGRAHNSGVRWVHSTLAEDYQRIGFEGAASFDSVSVTVDPDSGTEDFNLVPAGTVVMYGGGTAPAGWLVCDGSAVSRTTYSRLFANISTRYGVGDGSTTFNLPGTNTLVPVGIAASGNADGTTATGTSALNSLTLGDQSANHSHTVSVSVANASANHSHSWSKTFTSGNQSAGHSHGYDKSNGSNSSATTAGANASHYHNIASGTVTTNAANATHSHNANGSAGNNSANHTHALNASTIDTTINVEPFLFIIKT
jgi:microcystin-dependent protein